MDVVISLREAFDYLINGWFPRMFDWMFIRTDILLDLMKNFILEFINPLIDSGFGGVLFENTIRGIIDFVFFPFYFFGGEQIVFIFLLEQALVIFLVLHIIKLVRSAIGFL